MCRPKIYDSFSQLNEYKKTLDNFYGKRCIDLKNWGNEFTQKSIKVWYVERPSNKNGIRKNGNDNTTMK